MLRFRTIFIMCSKDFNVHHRNTIALKFRFLFFMNKDSEKIVSNASRLLNTLASAAGEETEENRIKKKLFKTKVCKHFLKGRCLYGDDCTFAHFSEEIQLRPNLHKTKMCAKNDCKDAACPYAHSSNELRVDENQKTLRTEHIDHEHQKHVNDQKTLLDVYATLRPSFKSKESSPYTTSEKLSSPSTTDAAKLTPAATCPPGDLFHKVFYTPCSKRRLLESFYFDEDQHELILNIFTSSNVLGFKKLPTKRGMPEPIVNSVEPSDLNRMIAQIQGQNSLLQEKLDANNELFLRLLQQKKELSVSYE